MLTNTIYNYQPYLKFKKSLDRYTHNVMTKQGIPDARNLEKGFYLYRHQNKTYALVIHEKNSIKNQETIDLTELDKNDLLQKITWPDQYNSSRHIETSLDCDLLKIIKSNCQHPLLNNKKPNSSSKKLSNKLIESLEKLKDDNLKKDIIEDLAELYYEDSQYRRTINQYTKKKETNNQKSIRQALINLRNNDVGLLYWMMIDKTTNMETRELLKDIIREDLGSDDITQKDQYRKKLFYDFPSRKTKITNKNEAAEFYKFFNNLINACSHNLIKQSEIVRATRIFLSHYYKSSSNFSLDPNACLLLFETLIKDFYDCSLYKDLYELVWYEQYLIDKKEKFKLKIIFSEDKLSGHNYHPYLASQARHRDDIIFQTTSNGDHILHCRNEKGAYQAIKITDPEEKVKITKIFNQEKTKNNFLSTVINKDSRRMLLDISTTHGSSANYPDDYNPERMKIFEERTLHFPKKRTLASPGIYCSTLFGDERGHLGFQRDTHGIFSEIYNLNDDNLSVFGRLENTPIEDNKELKYALHKLLRIGGGMTNDHTCSNKYYDNFFKKFESIFNKKSELLKKKMKTTELDQYKEENEYINNTKKTIQEYLKIFKTQKTKEKYEDLYNNTTKIKTVYEKPHIEMKIINYVEYTLKRIKKIDELLTQHAEKLKDSCNEIKNKLIGKEHYLNLNVVNEIKELEEFRKKIPKNTIMGEKRFGALTKELFEIHLKIIRKIKIENNIDYKKLSDRVNKLNYLINKNGKNNFNPTVLSSINNISNNLENHKDHGEKLLRKEFELLSTSITNQTNLVNAEIKEINENRQQEAVLQYNKILQYFNKNNINGILNQEQGKLDEIKRDINIIYANKLDDLFEPHNAILSRMDLLSLRIHDVIDQENEKLIQSLFNSIDALKTCLAKNNDNNLFGNEWNQLKDIGDGLNEIFSNENYEFSTYENKLNKLNALKLEVDEKITRANLNLIKIARSVIDTTRARINHSRKGFLDNEKNDLNKILDTLDTTYNRKDKVVLNEHQEKMKEIYKVVLSVNKKIVDENNKQCDNIIKIIRQLKEKTPKKTEFSNEFSALDRYTNVLLKKKDYPVKLLDKLVEIISKKVDEQKKKINIKLQNIALKQENILTIKRAKLKISLNRDHNNKGENFLKDEEKNLNELEKKLDNFYDKKDIISQKEHENKIKDVNLQVTKIDVTIQEENNKQCIQVLETINKLTLKISENKELSDERSKLDKHKKDLSSMRKCPVGLLDKQITSTREKVNDLEKTIDRKLHDIQQKSSGKNTPVVENSGNISHSSPPETTKNTGNHSNNQIDRKNPLITFFTDMIKKILEDNQARQGRMKGEKKLTSEKKSNLNALIDNMESIVATYTDNPPSPNTTQQTLFQTIINHEIEVKTQASCCFFCKPKQSTISIKSVINTHTSWLGSDNTRSATSAQQYLNNKGAESGFTDCQINQA